MAPSIKTLTNAFPHLDAESIRKIRFHMTNGTHPSRALAAIDGFLGTHGVEYIPHGHNAKSPSIEYCNAGDAYKTTVMFVAGAYRVGSWGDIVERGNYD